MLRLFCFVEENKVFRGIEHSVSSSETICFNIKEQFVLLDETNCSFMLEQIVLPYWNTLFCLDKTDCSL